MVEDVIRKEKMPEEGQDPSLAGTHEEAMKDEEILPIKPPLQVLKYRTIHKRFGWWATVVLLQSYAKKQICFYLWQRKDDVWKRKQKFGLHSKEDWDMIKEAVEGYINELT